MFKIMSPLRKVKNIQIVTLSLRCAELRYAELVEVSKCTVIKHIHSSTPMAIGAQNDVENCFSE